MEVAEGDDGLHNFLILLYCISIYTYVHEAFDSELFAKILVHVYGFNHVSAVLQVTLVRSVELCAQSCASESQPARSHPDGSSIPCYFWLFFLFFEIAVFDLCFSDSVLALRNTFQSVSLNYSKFTSPVGEMNIWCRLESREALSLLCKTTACTADRGTLWD